MAKRQAKEDDPAPANKKGGFKLPPCPFTKADFMATGPSITLEFELQPKAFGPGGYGWQKGGGIMKVEVKGSDGGSTTVHVRPSCLANVMGSKGGDQTGLSTAKFLEAAKPLKVSFEACPCEFSTGSFGWAANRREEQKVGGKALQLVLNANAPIDGSKAAADKETDDPVLGTIAPDAVRQHLPTIGEARAGERDDLTKIRGIGPWIQGRLNRIGIFKFRQLAAMTLEIEQAVNVAIKYFPGRVHRDEWVFQAQKMVGGKWEELNPIFARSGKSHTTKIDGQEYERELIDIAEYANKDGLIEAYEAEALWWSAMDGNKVTALERKTLEYILGKYNFDEEAESFLRSKLDSV